MQGTSLVENPSSDARGTGQIPGQGTKIPHAMGQLNPQATAKEKAHVPQGKSLVLQQRPRAAKRKKRICKLIMQCCFFFFSAKSLQSCLTLCNPIDGSPPGSPIPGILRARILQYLEANCICVFQQQPIQK